MKKIYILIGMIVLIMMTVGCKKEPITDNVNKPSIEGKVIEIREDNEILIEVTDGGGIYKEGDRVLIGYIDYHWTGIYVGANHTCAPKLNDLVATGYWKEEVEEKDGYDYIPGRSVWKYFIELKGKVLEVRDNNEILIEVTEKGKQYKTGQVILVSYRIYFHNTDSKETGNKIQKDVPKNNDNIVFYYYQENVGEKDGYTYMSNLDVRKCLDGSEE